MFCSVYLDFGHRIQVRGTLVRWGDATFWMAAGIAAERIGGSAGMVGPEWVGAGGCWRCCWDDVRHCSGWSGLVGGADWTGHSVVGQGRTGVLGGSCR